MTLSPIRFSGLDIWVSTPTELGVPRTYGIDLVDSRNPSVHASQIRVNQKHFANSGLVGLLTHLMDQGRVEQARALLPGVLERILKCEKLDSVEVDPTPVIKDPFRPKESVFNFFNRHQQALIKAAGSAQWYISEDPQEPGGRKLITNIRDDQ